MKKLNIDEKEFISWMIIENERNQLTSQIKLEDIDALTNLKIQKLLYFIEGCFIARFNKILFQEDYEAWDAGPVMKKIYKFIRYDCYSKINKTTFPNTLNLSLFSKNEKEFLQKTFNYWNSFSSQELVDFSHIGGPWRNTEKNKILKKELFTKEFLPLIDRID